ncbi:alpha/beta fold hydrolase [Martelella radicis]|uniref:Lysophospholipase n=1 Tax=Martelella radicis TaxID=1397476 RepID=A0A7W6PA33_9HYPH|nr:alpha/beta hydrolase [Martelella radicis]MBB4121991.1 lysophospholipase [Martelella radicis]
MDGQPAETIGMMRAFDGARLRYGLFQCDNARATVLIVAGRAEFIEKYAETVSDLRLAGYAVAILDLRGQGGSERRAEDGNMGHVDRFSDYPRDMLDFFSQHVEGHMPGPYFLLGHSLGGLIALAVAEMTPGRFAGLVLSAPFVGVRHHRHPAIMIRAMAWIASRTGRARLRTARLKTAPARFEEQNHTSDRARYERNIAAAKTDPPYLLGPVTFGWLSACLGAISRLTRPKALAAIDCPSLVLSAGRDALIPAKQQARVARRLGARHLVLEPSGHEILQETDAVRRPALDAILRFFEECLNAR